MTQTRPTQTLSLTEYLLDAATRSEAYAARTPVPHASDQEQRVAGKTAGYARASLGLLDGGASIGTVLAHLARIGRVDNLGGIAARRLRGEVLSRYGNPLLEQDTIDALQDAGVDPDSVEGLATLDAVHMDTAPDLAHLMSVDLLDACGVGRLLKVGLHVVPETAAHRITCPACKVLAGAALVALIERDHAEAAGESGWDHVEDVLAAAEEGRSSGPALTMEPTVFVLLITGEGLPDPLVSLHSKRYTAITTMRDQAERILRDRLGFCPVPVQERNASQESVRRCLAGYGIAATIGEQTVSL